MGAPIIICTGLMRTGSTWSFNVCRLLGSALAQTRGEPLGCAYLLDHELEQFIQDQAAKVPGPTVIKTHVVRRLAFDFICAGHAKAVCTIRDPRDCAVSMRTFVGGDVEQIAKGFVGGFDLLNLYKMSPNTLFVRYEQMMAQPLEEIRKMAAHLNVKISEEFVHFIAKETDLQNSREVCKDLKHRSEKQIRRSGAHRVDPVTCLHDNHIHSAESGRWRRELTSDQARSLTHLFRPWLLEFGYETPESLAGLEDIWRSVAAGLPDETITPAPAPHQTPPPGARDQAM